MSHEVFNGPVFPMIHQSTPDMELHPQFTDSTNPLSAHPELLGQPPATEMGYDSKNLR